MAGHSKFKNIMHRKGAQDAKRAKIFTKIGREIQVAAKLGGGDPVANPRLRAALAEARQNNMTNDRIKRCIEAGTGTGDTSDYVQMRYEGYAPGGRLSVSGTISGTTTVNSGGTLGGNGNLGSLVANGRIAPGNSIGTLNITGPVTFNSGSVYEVEVDASGNSDKLVATGAITINGGTVDIRAASGSYADNTVYNNILQGSSRTGTFSGVTTDLAFLTPTLSYDATSVDLALERNDVDFSVVAEDQVQVEVANAVQNLGSGNDLYMAFSGLNMSEASQALDTLSGEHNAGLTTATAQSAATIQNVISSRIQALGETNYNITDIKPAAGDDKDAEIKKSFWSEIFGSQGKSDPQGTAPGQNRESGGTLFGADAELSSNIFAGVFGGYEIGEVYTDTQFANSDIESFHAGIYGSRYITPSWRVSGGLIGSFHSIDTTRHIQFTGYSATPKGETNGYTISPSIEMGYGFTVKDINLEPFAGVNLTHSYISSYSEKEGGSSNLDVDSTSQTNPSHTLGLRLGKTFTVSEEVSLAIKTRAGWSHTYGDLDSPQEMKFSSGALPFEVKGAPIARNSAIVGIGADIGFAATDAKAYVNYSGEFAKDTDSQGVTLGVKVPF